MKSMEAESAQAREVQLFGQSLAQLKEAITLAGGPRHYVSQMLQSLDSYLQICEHSRRGADSEYVRRAINGIKRTIEHDLLPIPSELIHPDSQHPAGARAGDLMYWPDQGDGMRLAYPAAVGAFGLDPRPMALNTLSDVQDSIAAVGGNAGARTRLAAVASVMGAVWAHGYAEPPRTETEHGAAFVDLARRVMRLRDRAEASTEAMQRETPLLAMAAIRQARGMLGFDFGGDVRVAGMLEEIAESRLGLPPAVVRQEDPETASKVREVLVAAGEYARAARGEALWFEPQVSDGSGERFRPVAFVDGVPWQLVAVANVSAPDEPPQAYEARPSGEAWGVVDALRSRADQPGGLDRFPHLLWARMDAGCGAPGELELCTWAQGRERSAGHAPAADGARAHVCASLAL